MERPVAPRLAGRPGLGDVLRQAVTHLWTLVVDDARRWGISPRLAAVLIVVPPAATIALAVIGLDRPLFRFVTAEDSVIEWPQFFTLVVGVGIFAVAARAAAGGGRRWFALGCVAAAALSFFVAGEEISWGQRLLGFATPAGLAAINHQDELNLHNIGSAQTAFGYAEAAVGLYGSLLPLAFLAWPGLRRRLPLDRLLVPPLALVPAFGLVAGYRMARLLVFRAPHFGVVKFGELPELSLYLAVVITGWLIYRRLRSARLAEVAGAA